MTKHNASNERLKRGYFAYLKEAKRHSESPSISRQSPSLIRAVYTRLRDFRKFHIEQAIAFKRRLGEQRKAYAPASL